MTESTASEQETAPRQEAPSRLSRGQWIAVISAFALFTLIVGLAAIVVGGHDAALARAGFAVAGSSALLLATGVVLLFATAQLLGMIPKRVWKNERRPPCKLPVLVAFLMTLLLGVYVLFTTLKVPSTQRGFVVAAALLLIGFPAVGMYVFGRDARVTLPRLGAIALALVGTLIGAWEFWYQNHYIPSHAGSDVTLNAALKLTAHQPKFDVIHATLNYEDVGGNGVSVIGSTYTLTGARVVHCKRAATLPTLDHQFKNILPDPQRSRFMANVVEEQPATILAAGKFVRDGKRLDANVPFGRNLILYVPPDYQLLRMRAQLLAIPASVPLSQRNLPTFTQLKNTNDHEPYGVWHIDDDSWLHDLVDGRERWVVLRYEIVNPQHPTKSHPSPDLRVAVRFPSPTWTERPPSSHRLESLFTQTQTTDSSEPFADAELPLQPVADPNSNDLRQLPHCKTGV